MPNPLECLVTRGSWLESRHHVAALVVDVEGEVLFDSGDADELVSLRSSAKPFQARASVAAGAAEAAGFSGEEIALMCASHSGEPMHVAVVERMLGKLDLGPEALECGAHPPIHVASAEALRASGQEPSALHNNCSGKHAGMLALARHLGVDPAGYVRPDHPVQRHILGELAAATGARIDPAVDGCGVPCVQVPMRAAVELFASLARGADEASRVVFAAMAAHPDLVGGTERFDTEWIAALDGWSVSKVGAEGAWGVALRSSRGGHAGFFKVLDGADRAIPPVGVALLQQLGLLGRAASDALAHRRITVRRNHAGTEVGTMVARIGGGAGGPALHPEA